MILEKMKNRKTKKKSLRFLAILGGSIKGNQCVRNLRKLRKKRKIF